MNRIRASSSCLARLFVSLESGWLRGLALALLLVTCLLPSGPADAGDAAFEQTVQSIKDEWATTFYLMPADEQTPRFEALLGRVRELATHHPSAPEPLVLEALVQCGLAAADGGLGALGKVSRARDVLNQALAIDPMAMEASAYVMLGNLYYRMPPWPISFGDDELARRNLEIAYRLYPDALDTNFFYGDFLLDQDEFGQALFYLEKAEKAPIRAPSRLSDEKLKEELKQLLKDAREKNTDRSSFFSRFLASLRGHSSP